MTVKNELTGPHRGKISTVLYLAMDFKLLHDTSSCPVEACDFSVLARKYLQLQLYLELEEDEGIRGMETQSSLIGWWQSYERR